MQTSTRRGWPQSVWGAPFTTLQQGATTAVEVRELVNTLLEARDSEARQQGLRPAVVGQAARVLRSPRAPAQARAAAASIAAALSAQPCGTCVLSSQGDSQHEVVLPDSALISGLAEWASIIPPASALLAETMSALATLLRCAHCHSPCSRSVQQHVCSHGAVPAVLRALRASLPATPPSQIGCLPWLPPTMEALSLLTAGMPPAVLSDLTVDAWPLLKIVLVRSAKDPSVASSVATVLAALFPVWPAHGMMGRPQDGQAVHSESVLLVSNIATSSAASGHVDAARTAAWALACMAADAAWHPALADGAMAPGPQQQLWSTLAGQALASAIDLLAKVGQQDAGLAKNCLDYLKVIATASQPGGHPAAVAACGGDSVAQSLCQALRLASAVANLAPELRLQVAALRCMRALLAHPRVAGLLSDDEPVATVLRITSVARFTPGCNPKDVALVQVYGLCVLGAVLSPQPRIALQSGTAASIAPETHASLASVIAFVLDADRARASGMAEPWLLEDASHETVSAMCRLGGQCLNSHEDISPGLLATVGEATARIFHWCAAVGVAPAGVNAPDGSGVTVLHRLAASGLTDAVQAYVQSAGPALDWSLRDSSGLTALDVARMRGHMGVARLLSSGASDGQSSAMLSPASTLPTPLSPPSSQTATSTLPASAISMPTGLSVAVNRQQSVSTHSDGVPASARQLSLATRGAMAADQSPGTQTAEDMLGQNFMGDAAFRVNTAALSQLIGSVVNGSNKAALSQLPPWLSAGVAAAVSAQEEAVARLAASSQPTSATSAGGQALRADDLALIADAEALLNSQRLASAVSVGGSDAHTDDMGDFGSPATPKGVSKHLWLGNLSTKLPRAVLKAVFEHFGAVEDVVTFPGRMYAFVNFKSPEDAVRAAQALNDREVPPLTGNRRLVVKFRPSKKALGKTAEGPGADAAAAAAAAANATDAAVAEPQAAEMPADDAAAPAASPLQSLTSRPPSRSSIDSKNDDSESGSHSGSGAACSSGSIDEMAGLGAASESVAGAPVPGAPGGATSHPLGGNGSEEDLTTGGGSGSGSDDPCDASGARGTTSASAACITSSAYDGDATNMESSTPDSLTDADEPSFAEGRPSRHLWLGNIPLRPNKQAMDSLFTQFGPLESLRVFPGKTFAFVNYVEAADALKAKKALDGQLASFVTGAKPLVIRFQKDSGGPTPVQSPSASPGGNNPADVEAERAASCRSPTPVPSEQQPISASASCQQLMNAVASAARNAGGAKPANAPLPSADPAPASAATAGSVAASAESPGLSADASLASRLPALANLGTAALSKLLDEDIPEEPAINLSNRLNPNNVHFDKELAARYKRMTKAEKESLWAQDRMMQQIANNSAAAALLSAAQGVDPSALLAGSQLGLGGRALPNLANASLAGLTPAQVAELQQALLLQQALPGNNLAVAAAAAAQAQLQAAAAAQSANLQRGNSLQNLASGLWGNNGNANSSAIAQAALLQAQLGLLGVNNSVNAVSAQLLQQQQQQREQQQQQQLAALGNQQLQQQLAALSLAGMGSGGGSTDQLVAQLQQLQAAQQQQQQQQRDTQQLLNNLQAQAAYNRSQSELAALAQAQAQALAKLKASTQPQLQSGSFGGQSGLQGMNSFQNQLASQQLLNQQLQLEAQQQQLQLVQQLVNQQQQQQQPQFLQQKQLPTSFMCPLSGVLMTDPVVAADGVTYERAAITQWLERHNTSPTTRHPLAHKFLSPNTTLKAAVLQELTSHSLG